MGEARAGLRDARLTTVEVSGTSYCCHGEPELGPFSPRAHMLQILDEAHRGFSESQRVTEREVRFDVTAWREWAPDELAAIDRAAARYGEFLGRAPVVRIAPR